MPSRFTCHKTFEAAQAIADANAADDADWTYTVEENTLGFYVAIYEDGERVGTL
jgi:hypothetical protein